jgi:hypothetical protein
MNAVRRTTLGIATLGLLVVGLSGCGQNPMSPIATSESNAVRNAAPPTSADQMSMPIDEAAPPTGDSVTVPTPAPAVIGGGMGGRGKGHKPKKPRHGQGPGGDYAPVP